MTDPQVAQEETLTTQSWQFWASLMFFVAVIVGLISFSLSLSEHVSQGDSAPVSNIVVTGEIPYTRQHEILAAVEQVNLSNFFDVDVNQVQHLVADLPWVYSVAVRKHWPNELKIYVVDQVPVAFWNGDFLINQEGVAFQADVSRVQAALPAFFGPEGSEQLALENFRNLNRLLKFSDLAIAELMLSERYAWQLTLTDGVLLNLGRENRVERVQRFMDVYPSIKQEQKADQQVDYVDLRYDTGLAVGWKPLEQEKRA